MGFPALDHTAAIINGKFSIRQEIDAAIAGVQKGKLTTDEIEYLNLYGYLHRDRLKIGEIPP